MQSTITRANLNFLKQLKQNNKREWFNANKTVYQEQHANTITFADALLAEMNKHDLIETPSGKKSLYRIYRDIRFSKNKSPYKTHWGGYFRRATQQLRGGYYFHIQPGNSFAGGGFWAPNPGDLKRIRQEIAHDDKELRKILADNTFIETFGELTGEGVKTAPKGYSKDHPAIDLLRLKQFLIGKSFTDKEVLQDDFHLKVNDTFKKMRPFFDYMSEVLTTDENGVPLYDE